MQSLVYLSLGAALLLLGSCAGAPAPAEARARALSLLDDDVDAAVRYMRDLESNDLGLEIVRAQASLKTGATVDAMARYTKVADTAHDVELAEFARRNLATLQMQAGQPAAAFATLNKLGDEAKKDPKVQYELGVAAVSAGRLDLARQHFSKLPKAERQRVDDILGQDFLTRR